MTSLFFWMSVGGVSALLTKSSMNSLEIWDVLTLSLVWLTTGALILTMMLGMAFITLGWSMFFILMGAFMASKLFIFYVLFELSLVPILLMLLFMGSQPERISAGSYLLLYTLFFSLPFMLLMIWGTTYQVFPINNGVLLSHLFTMFAIAPFLVKMPIFGLHFWLPKAHVEANTLGSMLLASLLLKLGSYGLSRILCSFLISSYWVWSHGAWILLTIISSALTFMQSDLKKLIAYSSVTHMTFMMLGIMGQVGLLFVSVTILSLAHGWASAAMFKMAGSLSHMSHSRLSYIASTTSLGWFLLLNGVILMSNASIPPLPSFFPEVALVTIFKSFLTFVSSLFLMLSFLVCYYNAFLFLTISHAKSSENGWSTLTFLEGMTTTGFILLSLASICWLRLC